jgi:hypothetical protein
MRGSAEGVRLLYEENEVYGLTKLEDYDPKEFPVVDGLLVYYYFKALLIVEETLGFALPALYQTNK